MKIKNELKTYRNHLRLTQEEVSTKAKIPLRSYQSYEQGERLPNVKVGMRIAKALKTYPNELWLDDSEIKRASKYFEHIERNWPKLD
jgi:Predicted transcriptional regulators